MTNDKKKLGVLGENLAARYLESKGYRIIGRNWRSGRKEIDIVAASGPVTVFCEIKTRSGGSFPPAGPEAPRQFAAPAGAVKSRQLQTLKKAISSYARQKKIDLDEARLDLLLIDIDRTRRAAVVRHFKKII